MVEHVCRWNYSGGRDVQGVVQCWNIHICARGPVGVQCLKMYTGGNTLVEEMYVGVQWWKRCAEHGTVLK